MEFRIADTFTDALARLPAQDQKAAKTTAFDLQMDPSAPGLQFHRIDKSKDRNFWSMRVNRDIRIIVHKTDASLLLAYVDHHDEAYAWAERRRIEAHPKTGAVQIVEVRELIEEIAPRFRFDDPAPAVPQKPAAAPALFAKLSRDELLSTGVPEDWIADVLKASEDQFFDLAPHLPAEAAEALLQYATVGALPKLEPAKAEDPYSHPDALRRFRTVENLDELRQALDAPWEKWAVFLHPSQRQIVERAFTGPARVAGSAGTGKTVVALHRAVRLAQSAPNARVLLATFSEPLARALGRKARFLTGESAGVVPRLHVASLPALASELFQLAFGRKPHVASQELVNSALAKASELAGDAKVNMRFIHSEWTHVIEAWQVADAETYSQIPRLGRKNRMGSKQRDRLWPIFAGARRSLRERGFVTPAQIFSEVSAHYVGRAEKPFTHIVVDEAQDLGVPELRLLAAIAPEGGDSLFFAGDLGQRIFQQPFSWKSLGVDLRGRSTVLKVNYRTSHQIRRAADRLMPSSVRDVDGLEEDRKATVSVFDGPEPKVIRCPGEKAEAEAVAAFIKDMCGAGLSPSDIGIFVRSRAELPRAWQVAKIAGLDARELTERGDEGPECALAIGTMHFAKGLEFKAVVVMACDDEIIPSQSRIDSVADEVELEDVYETERQLLYVSCTRARDRLLVTAVAPGSEFLSDVSSSR
jgi:hypothetical protein